MAHYMTSNDLNELMKQVDDATIGRYIRISNHNPTPTPETTKALPLANCIYEFVNKHLYPTYIAYHTSLSNAHLIDIHPISKEIRTSSIAIIQVSHTEVTIWHRVHEDHWNTKRNNQTIPLSDPKLYKQLKQVVNKACSPF